MKYVILFEDNDEFAHMRPQLMPDHLQFLRDHAAQIDAAGPLKDARSSAAAGGIWIVEAADVEQAQQLVETDPFWPTGLRKAYAIIKWTQVYSAGSRLIQPT